MHTNFSGRGLSGFRAIATFKNGQISLSDHGLCDFSGFGDIATLKNGQISLSDHGL